MTVVLRAVETTIGVGEARRKGRWQVDRVNQDDEPQPTCQTTFLVKS